MKKLLCLPILFSLLFAACQDVRAGSDLEILRQRFIAESLAPPVDQANVEKWMNSIREDGTWPGINYEDVSRTGFQHGQHLDHLVDLSRAYKKPGSALKGNKRLKKAKI